MSAIVKKQNIYYKMSGSLSQIQCQFMYKKVLFFLIVGNVEDQGSGLHIFIEIIRIVITIFFVLLDKQVSVTKCTVFTESLVKRRKNVSGKPYKSNGRLK